MAIHILKGKVTLIKVSMTRFDLGKRWDADFSLSVRVVTDSRSHSASFKLDFPLGKVGRSLGLA